MRIEKENDFTSFSKILNKIDAGSLGEQEIRMIKQEHSYLEKLRQQRIKIEELKRKYDEVESYSNQVSQQNEQLHEIIKEKDDNIRELEQAIDSEVTRRENAERQLQKISDQDKGKNKTRVRELEHENEELKKILRQKQFHLISLEEDSAQKVKSLKENFQAEKKSIIIEYEERLNDFKVKVNEGQILELRNLVNRQNKALKSQNQKYEDVCEKNEALLQQIEEMQQIIEKKNGESELYEERMNELREQMEEMEQRLQEQNNNNKLKDQLEDIRKKMNELQKGEIERIQFIVNEMQ